MRGQLTDSSWIGYKGKINIDCLPLDYDILDDISYIYPAGNNYFIYTSRGCKRCCKFCAVSTLEPDFFTTNNVIQQVGRVDEIYGKKRNMLIMDNNTLFSDQLESIVDDILSLGFTGEKNYFSPNPFTIMMNKIKRRKNFNINFIKQVKDIVTYLNSFSTVLKNKEKIYNRYIELLDYINKSDAIWRILKANEKELTKIIEKYRSKQKVVRYIDFNQGIDSRLINNESCALLAKLPIKPFRLAYDSMKETRNFIRATEIAIKNNISNFSNYMLYNFDDHPTELWNRLFNAITLYNSTDIKLNAFSFPMKYAPVNEKDRSYIGKYWNRKFLSAINIILNVTKGVVVKEIDFFYEAYGKNTEEYLIILTMPDEFIRWRHFFRDNGLIAFWRELYDILTKEEKRQLLRILCDIKSDRTKITKYYTKNIDTILQLYTINKSQFERGEITANVIVRRIKKINVHKNEFPEKNIFPSSSIRCRVVSNNRV
jgi:hypothetical protein